jgi:hypothetical protein
MEDEFTISQNDLRDVTILYIILSPKIVYGKHFKLCSITAVATKVHVILWSFVVLTWMHDIVELV